MCDRANPVKDGLFVVAGGEIISYLFLAGCIRCILVKASDCMLMSHMYICMHMDLVDVVSKLSEPSLWRSKTTWGHLLSVSSGYQSCNVFDVMLQ